MCNRNEYATNMQSCQANLSLYLNCVWRSGTKATEKTTQFSATEVSIQKRRRHVNLQVQATNKNRRSVIMCASASGKCTICEDQCGHLWYCRRRCNFKVLSRRKRIWWNCDNDIPSESVPSTSKILIVNNVVNTLVRWINVLENYVIETWDGTVDVQIGAKYKYALHHNLHNGVRSSLLRLWLYFVEHTPWLHSFWSMTCMIILQVQ